MRMIEVQLQEKVAKAAEFQASEESAGNVYLKYEEGGQNQWMYQSQR